MTTTATRSLTTTVLRCSAPACHSHGLPGFLVSRSTDGRYLQLKCPKCGTSNTIDLSTNEIVLS